MSDLQQETTDAPAAARPARHGEPARERAPAAGGARGLLRDAGFEVTLLGRTEARPNLVARLRGAQDGPTLCLLSHVDTVLAHPDEWRHDPWSGEVVDGELWGRGAIDMKSQTAAEVAATSTGPRGLAPGPRRPARRRDGRRGGRRHRRRDLADRAPPRPRALRRADQRGRGLRHPLRRRAAARRLRGREGRLPLHRDHRRHRRPRLDAAPRRQRAAEDGAAPGRDARRAPGLRRHTRRGAAARRPRRRARRGPGRRGRGRSARWTRGWPRCSCRCSA